MTDLEKERRRGEHAKQLLADQLLNEVLDEMEKDTVSMWEQSPARDVEAREHLHLFYLACKQVRERLKTILDTGKMAEQQLTLMEKVKQKLFN